MREDVQFEAFLQDCVRESLVEPPAELVRTVMEQVRREEKLRKNRTLVRRISTGFVAAAAVLVIVTVSFPYFARFLPGASLTAQYKNAEDMVDQLTIMDGASGGAGTAAPQASAAPAQAEAYAASEAAPAEAPAAAPLATATPQVAEPEGGTAMLTGRSGDSAGSVGFIGGDAQYQLVAEELPEELSEYSNLKLDTVTAVYIPQNEIESVLTKLRDSGFTVEEYAENIADTENLVVLCIS